MRRRDLLRALAGTTLAAAAGGGWAMPPPRVTRTLFAAGESTIAIGAFDEFGDGNFLFDYAHHRAGRLTPGSKGRLSLLSSFDAGGAPAAELRVVGDTLSFDGGRWSKVHVARRRFAAESRGARLAAEVAQRADRTPVGTILLVYGSGPGPGQGLDLWAFHFLARGWAVVSYDKRGSGASGGDWRRATLEDLAVDARAVMSACPRAPGPFGAWGISQAGWILPELAAAGAVDFVIMHAGAARHPGEQILDQVEAELVAYGFPAEEVDRARAYYALDTDVSRGRVPWSAIEAAYARASADKAEWLIAPPAAADASDRTLIRLLADFDPAPYWQRTTVPVLALFGSKDVIVPPARNVELLKSLVPTTTALRVDVLENANHLFMIADSGVRAEYPKCTRMHPEYFNVIDTWLAATVGR